MNITYKIENYYAEDQRAFVVYQKDTLPPMGAWVQITPEMSQADITAAVIAATPVHKWESHTANAAVQNLLGVENTVVYTTPQVPEPEAVDLAQQIRSQRNSLLRSSDWTQTIDAPLTSEQQTQWQTYRQALRDVTSQAGFPSEVIWPTKPV